MAVPASRNEFSCPGLIPCSEITVVEPKITYVDGNPSLAKTIGLELVQSQVLTVKWTMRNPYGDTVNLRMCSPITSKFIMKESISSPSSSIVIPASIDSLDSGIVSFSLNDQHTSQPGIYVGEIGIFNQDDKLLMSNRVFLIINSSLFSMESGSQGPPSINEIRLSLRSSSPADSPLLGEREWDVSEICYAIQRPVMYWNESPPPIGIYFNTSNFPYKYYWMEGITGELMILAANFYRREHLPYNAAGISVDDRNKFQQYEAEGYRKRMIFEKFVYQKKVSLNAECGYATFSSDYLMRR